jgi:ATP-dependent Clp protease ATP-binding subunit ClpC
MYDRFTDHAQRVITLAWKEARRLQHECISTEHILLGLIQEGTGVAATALKQREVKAERIRAEVEKLTPGPAHLTLGKVPIAQDVKKVLESASKEAVDFGDKHIGTEHLLLGILRQDGSAAAKSLRDLGLEAGEARRGVLKLLGRKPEEPEEPGEREKRPASARRRLVIDEIDIVDPEGKVRMRLGLGPDESPRLELFDAGGVARLVISLGPGGEPALDTTDAVGKVVRKLLEDSGS